MLGKFAKMSAREVMIALSGRPPALRRAAALAALSC